LSGCRREREPGQTFPFPFRSQFAQALFDFGFFPQQGLLRLRRPLKMALRTAAAVFSFIGFPLRVKALFFRQTLFFSFPYRFQTKRFSAFGTSSFPI